jgi:hypothetical protein
MNDGKLFGICKLFPEITVEHEGRNKCRCVCGLQISVHVATNVSEESTASIFRLRW